MYNVFYSLNLNGINGDRRHHRLRRGYLHH